jgi:hypothetical protein
MEPCRTSPAAKMPGTLVSRKKGFAVKRPVLWRLSIAHQVGAGENETPLVALYHALQPTCMRLRANEDEQRGCRERLFLVRFVIDDRDAF